jgi:hypothetical protein
MSKEINKDNYDKQKEKEKEKEKDNENNNNNINKLDLFEEDDLFEEFEEGKMKFISFIILFFLKYKIIYLN